MTMELEGNLSLERAPTRRWVSIIAVIIPVAAIVLLAAWFIRVYVAPATVLIPNPPMIVAEPAEPPPASSVRAQTEAPPAADGDGGAGQPAGAANKPPPRCRCLRRWRPCRRRLAARRPAYADPVQDGSPAPIDHGGRDGSDRTGRADRRSCSAAAGQAARPRRAARRCDTTAAAAAGGDRGVAGRHSGGRPPRDPLIIPSRRRLRSAPAQNLQP